MDKLGLNEIMQELGKRRKAFYSERDFQFGLAWLLKEKLNCEVLLEYHGKQNSRIDIVLVKDGKYIPIELKYKTVACDYNLGDETCHVKSHYAQPIGRYLYLHDIIRIESFLSQNTCCEVGYAILLTNDHSYWNEKNTSFPLLGTIKGDRNYDWNASYGEGTIKKHEKPIRLVHSYNFEWKPYGNVIDGEKQFRYLITEVKD